MLGQSVQANAQFVLESAAADGLSASQAAYWNLLIIGKIVTATSRDHAPSFDGNKRKLSIEYKGG